MSFVNLVQINPDQKFISILDDDDDEYDNGTSLSSSPQKLEDCKLIWNQLFRA